MAKVVSVPGNFPTLRISHAQITFDGGMFVLSVSDMRPTSTSEPGSPAAEYGAFEVGRFALSPVTLQWLADTVDQARTAYENAMGHPLPDPAKLQASLSAEAIAEDVRNQQRGAHGPHPDS